MSWSKQHYFAIAFFFIALVLLGWSCFVEAQKLKTVSQPLSERFNAHLAAMKFHDNSYQGEITYDLAKISQSPFFKTYKKPEPKKVVAQKTRLKLTLEGTIADVQSELSRAVIMSNNKSESYKIGDKILGTNAELHAVEEARVIIERAGVLESLDLVRKKIDMDASDIQKLFASSNGNDLAVTDPDFDKNWQVENAPAPQNQNNVDDVVDTNNAPKEARN